MRTSRAFSRRIRRVARIEPQVPDGGRRIEQLRRLCKALRRFDRLKPSQSRNAIAFKSVIAYRSGLHIENPTDEEVRKDYERSKATRARDVKHIRDWYVRRVISTCPGARHHLPHPRGDGRHRRRLRQVQPDAALRAAEGPGDLEDQDLPGPRRLPVLAGGGLLRERAEERLRRPLRDDTLREHVGAIEKTQQILDMAPPARVVFGSDGVVIPEIHWAGAKIGRQVLEARSRSSYGRRLRRRRGAPGCETDRERERTKGIQPVVAGRSAPRQSHRRQGRLESGARFA